MKFHTENIKSYLSSPVFNKNKTKIFILITVVVYLILGSFNIYQYLLTQLTVPVCAAARPLVKNQRIEQANIAQYDMTLKEFQRYSLQRTSSGLTNRIVRFEDAGRIIGKFSGYSKMAGEFLMYNQIISTQIDNSRMILYSYPGKIIVELDISNSNLSTFKKMLQVGDKINIGCSYDIDQQVNLSIQEAVGGRSSNRIKSLDVETVIVDDLFIGVTIADILNSQGESLLDYYTYLNTLTAAERYAIENSDEYTKKTKVNNLLLALTPAEEKEYRYYARKDGIRFNISIPQIDD